MTIAQVSNERIPNNVNLSEDKRLKRALEGWQPNFLNWWKEMGPEGFQTKNIYLRTAISVDTDGWADFGYVSMPEYRWGIFLTPPEKNKTIPCGDDAGKPMWQKVPGEHRSNLRRLIVTQGDTEPASVEQQRLLGLSCPSLYDLRNLFQVNVEEGRHLWAMVYLLHTYFGRDGREEAQALLDRRSGHEDKPRILETFNEPVSDWLSFFMFANFTDRDGKFQLLALAESAFEPLARTCRFMLTEEAHHLFVGQTGIQRIIRRTCELMHEFDTDDVKPHGGIPLEIIQRYINYWFSSSVDLFGSELSSNSAGYFAAGLKGRAYETRNYTDHIAKHGTYALDQMENGKVVNMAAPIRTAANEMLREDYIADTDKAMLKWNKELAKNNVDLRLKLPSKRFNRNIGCFAGFGFDTNGNLCSQTEYDKILVDSMPSKEDRVYVQSLMKQETAPGKFAGYISPPIKGLNGRPIDFEYVLL